MTQMENGTDMKLQQKKRSTHIQSKKVKHMFKIKKTKVDNSQFSTDIVKMINTKDLKSLKKAISHHNDLPSSGKSFKKRKRKCEENKLEEEYEKGTEENNNSAKRIRYLLPVKTTNGLLKRAIEEEIEPSEDEKPNMDKGNAVENEDNLEETESLPDIEEDKEFTKPLSAADILARREEILSKYKFRIGLLASGLLEDPQKKVKNISLLLDTMDSSKPDVRLTVQKLVLLSLTEVFKDILPAYQIKHQGNSSVKLKKDTKSLQDFENSLLKGYKSFLIKLEKLAKVLHKKKGDTRVRSEQVLRLGELALDCISELFVCHTYFNYNRNIVQMLTPYLNHPRESVRHKIASCYSKVFKDDKRGEITLDIVRRVNHLVKSRSHTVYKEVVSVMLSLRIKDVNLDLEKEAEVKQKKFMTHKQKLLAMSKRERKRSKKLEELEREMLETKAEENKESKQKNLTEVMKVAFTIYFRILKKAPSSKVLSSALEGLAKFAHCINFEFFADLVSVLDALMDSGTLKHREKLHCVETVFAILSGQGEVLNIDPSRFYTHLYNNLFHVHAGKTQDDMMIVLRIMEVVLIQRRKKITQQRLLAFTKRLAILACQVLHNGAVGSLSIIRKVMQLGMGVDVLLDADSTLGQGLYNPELEEPEHCNAASTALWELTLLRRHYHPTVRTLSQLVTNDNNNASHMPTEIAKLNSVQLFDYFDSSQVVFKPSIPPPPKNISGNVKPKEDSNFIHQLKQSISSEISENDILTIYKEVIGRNKVFQNIKQKKDIR